MAKIGYYIIIVAVALNHLQLAQLIKLPVLVQHFQEHRQRDARVTFVEYLAMHYFGKDINDDDDDRDRQLPFKDETCVHFSCYDTPLRHIEAPAPLTFALSSIKPYISVAFPHTVQQSLFRPPQS
jgi:hypothetical protein